MSLWVHRATSPHMCMQHIPARPPPKPIRIHMQSELGKALWSTRVFRRHFSSLARTSYSPTLGEPGKRLLSHEWPCSWELVTLALPRGTLPLVCHWWQIPLLLWKRMSKNFLENESFYDSYTSTLPKEWEPFSMVLYLSYGLGWYGGWGNRHWGFQRQLLST